MGIVDEDIAKVREATDLAGIVSQYLQLKRVGRRWMGLCPFHAEKSPSFSVNGEDGLYYCFGCQKSGDAITFVREIEHLDFVGAVEWLAAKANVTLRYDDAGQGESRKRRQQLYDVMERAVEWYHQRLLTGADGGAARSYLRSRGFSGDEVRQYRLGWAPAAWDDMVRALGLSADLAVDTGLGFVNKTGRLTDSFRGRVLFPICDPEGRPVALGGRIMPGEDGPKYKNSPATKLYDKGKVLYGLNWHKGAIVGEGAGGEVIVCEGYTDVIGFARAGVPRAVATCGTALTEDHVKLLSRFAKRIVLAFDADAAGQGAADRFHAWEQRYELEVCVADLPAGVDPGELAQRDPARLQASVVPVKEWRPGEPGAKPYLAFRLDRVLGAADLSTVEGRARAATAGVDVIREHPDELVRDPYLLTLADWCRLEVEPLRAQLRRRAGAPPPAVAPSRERREHTHGAEQEALILAVHRRDEMLPWLDEPLFTDERHLVVYWALCAEPTVRDAVELLSGTDPAAAELLARLAASDSDAAPDDVGALLLGLAAERRLRELEAEARSAEDPLALASTIAAFKLAAQEVREPATRVDAAGRLLALLAPADGEERRTGAHPQALP